MQYHSEFDFADPLQCELAYTPMDQAWGGCEHFMSQHEIKQLTLRRQMPTRSSSRQSEQRVHRTGSRQDRGSSSVRQMPDRFSSWSGSPWSQCSTQQKNEIWHLWATKSTIKQQLNQWLILCDQNKGQKNTPWSTLVRKFQLLHEARPPFFGIVTSCAPHHSLGELKSEFCFTLRHTAKKIKPRGMKLLEVHIPHSEWCVGDTTPAAAVHQSYAAPPYWGWSEESCKKIEKSKETEHSSVTNTFEGALVQANWTNIKQILKSPLQIVHVHSIKAWK